MRGERKTPAVPKRVKQAIKFLLEQKADLQAAAAAAGLTTYELRRQLGKPHIVQYARSERRATLEALCLSSPAALTEVLRGQNEMAKVQAVKTAELLQQGDLQAEAAGKQRIPGLQIVIVQSDGSQQVAYQPPPMLDVTPAPEAEPVPTDVEWPR
jgi:hypothetical protein